MDISLKKVAVIGGGLAGLSVASSLAETGTDVTLFEAAPQLGGRARRVVWKNQRLDNGQHILLGAYQQTLKLMNSVGIDEKKALMRLPVAFIMHKSFSFQSHNLPAPLNLLLGLLMAKGLIWHERFAAIRFFVWLKISHFKLNKDEPLINLLNKKKQPTRLIKWLWEPLCLAALNTPIDKASAQTYLNVLRDSFNQSKTDSDLLLPRVDLSALLCEPIADHIKKNGGKIALNTVITDIKQTANGFGLKINSNEIVEFSHVVIATSPHHLQSITSHLDIIIDSAFDYQPIYTIYIQYPSHIKLNNVMTGFTQGISQWVFDRGQICNQDGLIAVIISAKGIHQTLSQKALADAVIHELKAAFPYLPSPQWHKVIAEKRATFSCTSGLKRPNQVTHTANVYLAGDYTEGDYPATIEGAIRSGLSAAQLVLQS